MADSLWVQITEHTEYDYVTAALYCVGEELENLMRTNKQIDRQRTDREFNYRGYSNPHGLLGERANNILIIYKTASLTNTDSFMDCIPYFPVQFKGWIRKTVNSMKSNQS